MVDYADVAAFYLLLSVFTSGFLFAIWNKDGWFNIILKTVLFFQTVIGVVVITTSLIRH